MVGLLLSLGFVPRLSKHQTGMPLILLRDKEGPHCTLEDEVTPGYSYMEIEPCVSWVENSRTDFSQDVRKENVVRN